MALQESHKADHHSQGVEIITTLLNIPCIFRHLISFQDKCVLRIVSPVIQRALNMEVPTVISSDEFLYMLPSLRLASNPRKLRVKTNLRPREWDPELDVDDRWHEIRHIDKKPFIEGPMTIIAEHVIVEEGRLEMYGYLEAPALIMKDGPCPWELKSDYRRSTHKWHYTRWVKGWIFVDPDSDIGDFGPHPLPTSYKVGWDFMIFYGDGGESDLVYPIYVNEELNFEHRKELCRLSLALHNERRDKQSNNVTYDIIDPNLHMLPLESPPLDPQMRELSMSNSWGHIAEVHSFMVNSRFKQLLRLFHYKVDEVRLPLRRLCDRLSDHLLLREQFHWVPADVLVDKNGNVKFCSPIHQLPSSHSQLSIVLERLLEKMVPLFRKIGVFHANREKWQVVTKIQCYNLKPGQEYNGHWHREGLVENIIAAGVYYVHVSPLLEGGKVVFLPDDAPTDFYFPTRLTQVSVPTSTDTALVFSNTLPHRHGKIFNGTDKDQQRLFVNFFVIDPDLPLRSTAAFQAPDIPSSEQLLLRERLRAEMSQKNDWGQIGWGNCATLVFRSYLDDPDNDFSLVNDELIIQ